MYQIATNTYQANFGHSEENLKKKWMRIEMARIRIEMARI